LPGTQNNSGAMLFLDEIAELIEGAQLKLLQMLQTLERTPVLVEREHGIAMRFVAATNRALAAIVERGDFRRELFWRLNVFSLVIPPLRQRAGDIAILAKLFLRRANPRRIFTPMALRVMSSYAFPGNIMELENLVTRLAIAPLGTGNSLIDVPDVRRHLMLVPTEDEQPTSGWKSSREEARRAMILRTIAAAGGNRAEAARKLGISTRALQYHITKAGLSRPSIRLKPTAVQAPTPDANRAENQL
jgi:DNA-binding NtrC family response regulator